MERKDVYRALYNRKQVINNIRIALTIINAIPSLRMIFFETIIDLLIPENNKIKITIDGMTIALNIALPAVVPIPHANPSVSCNRIKKKIVVKSSGIELAIAFIVAPLTPSDKFLPKYSEETSNPLLALAIMIHEIIINITEIKITLITNYKCIWF